MLAEWFTSKRPELTTLLALVAAAVVTASASQTKKAVVVEQGHVDREAPPVSLEGMWVRAGAVAVVKVLSATPYESDTVPLSTTYEVQVDEVLKNDSHLTGVGGIVSVFRWGSGQADEGDHIRKLVDRDFPEFVQQGTYLLFLNWNPHTQLFVDAYGPDGAYEIADGLVRSAGKGSVAQSVQGQSAEDFLNRLRGIRDKHR